MEKFSKKIESVFKKNDKLMLMINIYFILTIL